MIRVTTAHGREFVGRSRAEIVRQMRDDAWLWDDRKTTYMQAVRDRVLASTGHTIGISIDPFIEDLARAGYITEEVLH